MAKAKGTKGSSSGKAKASAPKARAAASVRSSRSARPAAKVARPSGTARGASARGPAAKAAPAKPAAAHKSASVKPPAVKTPAVKPPVSKAPPARPSTPAPAVVAPSTPPAAGTDPNAGLRTKKKVKRGAPPMLPRRLARRPLPPAGTEGSSPPPPPKATVPGSLHAPARAPEGAEGLKARLMAVTGDLARLRALKRSLNKQFWDAGEILAHLSRPELYQAKGYGSWEAFLEREIERELAIGRTLAVDLVRIVRVFKRETAEELGLERLRAAVRALWPEPGAVAPAAVPPSSGGTSAPWNPEGGGA